MLQDPAGIGRRTDSWGPTANTHTVLWAIGAASEPLVGRVAREGHVAYPDPTGSLVWPAASGRAAPRWPLRPLSGKLDKARRPSRPRRQARSNFPAPCSSQRKRRLPVQTAAGPQPALRRAGAARGRAISSHLDPSRTRPPRIAGPRRPVQRQEIPRHPDASALRPWTRGPRWPVADLAQVDSVSRPAALRAFAARPPLDVEGIWTEPRNSGRTLLASAP